MKTSHWIILAIVAYVAYANRAKIAAFFAKPATSITQMGAVQTVADKFTALEKAHPVSDPLIVTRVQ